MKSTTPYLEKSSSSKLSAKPISNSTGTNWWKIFSKPKHQTTATSSTSLTSLIKSLNSALSCNAIKKSYKESTNFKKKASTKNCNLNKSSTKNFSFKSSSNRKTSRLTSWTICMKRRLSSLKGSRIYSSASKIKTRPSRKTQSSSIGCSAKTSSWSPKWTRCCQTLSHESSVKKTCNNTSPKPTTPSTTWPTDYTKTSSTWDKVSPLEKKNPSSDICSKRWRPHTIKSYIFI
jgi:hypothetical protein